MKVAREGAVAIGLTIDSVRGGERGLVIGVRVKADASIVDDISESVVEMGQQTGGTASDDVLDKIVRVHPPTRKVADNFHRPSVPRDALLCEEFGREHCHGEKTQYRRQLADRFHLFSDFKKIQIERIYFSCG